MLFSVDEEVKGKQVQVLCDLVTVCREYGAMKATGVKLGRRPDVSICEPGNLPSAGTGRIFPNHEELIVLKHTFYFIVLFFTILLPLV